MFGGCSLFPYCLGWQINPLYLIIALCIALVKYDLRFFHNTDTS